MNGGVAMVQLGVEPAAHGKSVPALDRMARASGPETRAYLARPKGSRARNDQRHENAREAT